MSEPIVIRKAPGLIKDYELTWEDAASDPITVSAWTPAVGLTIVSSSIAPGGPAVRLRLSSGTDNTNYSLVNAVTFTSGQTDSRVVTVEVRARASVVPVLVSTVGAATANSYTSLLQADTYFAARPGSSDWFDANSSEKELALITATRVLDQFDYTGIPVTVLDDDIEAGYSESATPQALKWPRVLNTNGDLIRNYIITVIPPPIQRAQCEVALWLLQTGATAAAVVGGISKLRIGEAASVEFAQGSAAVVDTSVDSTGLAMGAARHLKGLRLYSVLA
jgi:hypothetical protein